MSGSFLVVSYLTDPVPATCCRWSRDVSESYSRENSRDPGENSGSSQLSTSIEKPKRYTASLFFPKLLIVMSGSHVANVGNAGPKQRNFPQKLTLPERLAHS